jgi:antitoxin component YwqK of YwqJK toxin-antitoxin module
VRVVQLGSWLVIGCAACGPAMPARSDADAQLDQLEQATPKVDAEVSADEIERARGRVTLDGAAYSGFVVEHHADGSLASRAGYVDGLAQGWHQAWYPTGQLRHRKYYEAGKREGEHLGWRANGELEFRRHYLADLSHGKQEFFQIGNRLVEEKHFEFGHEEGRQRGWKAEGELVMNYTVKHGKRYGIVGRNDCVSVVDE